MKSKKLIGWFVCMIFLVLTLSFASAESVINPEEYFDEFNNEGESCSVSDVFFYTDSNNRLGFVTMYECCTKDQCLKIPFDVQRKKELQKADLEETFNVNFARDKIRGGDLVPSNYFPESFDVCSYFSDKLPEQSRNLAVKTADNVEEFAPKNARKIYKTIRGVGFATGILTEFEIGVFVVGVGCNKLSKQKNEAFFKVGECYNNIQNIESGTVHYGITSQTYTCMNDADFLLSQVLDSWGQKIKGAVNKVANTAKTIWDWGKDLSQGNLSADFSMSETNYEAAQRIKGKLSIEKDYLNNPNSALLSENAQERLAQKKYSATNTYNNLKQEYEILDDKVPGWFSEFVGNVFYKPNVDYSQSRANIKNTKANLKLMDDLIDISKYNSAERLNKSIHIDISEGLNSYESQIKIERKFDWITLLLWILIIGGLVFAIKKYLK